MSFWDTLAKHGDRPALISQSEHISYIELARRADLFRSDVAAGLPAGVTRPLILLETVNEPEPIVAYLGALRAGWPVILVAPGAAKIESPIVRTYRPNVVLRRETGWRPDFEATDGIDMHSDLAVLLSTSGTTGAAKLVRLSRQNLSANAESIVAYLGVQPDDRAITLLPFHYSYGMSVLHIHLLCGAAVVLSEGSLIDPDLRALAQRMDVTSLALVPTQFELLDDTGWLPKLRYITQAGGRIDPVLARRFAAKAAAEGWKLFIMYGQTEAAPRMSYVPPQDAQAWYHTIGRPVSGGSFRLLDAAGAEIGDAGVTGELVYEGPNVMLGYAVTRADLAAPAGPSVLHTGDMAERLDNGYFRITGRASRFVKLFGLRVSMDEVEAQLRASGSRVYVCGTDARLVVFVQDDPDTPALQARIAERYQLPHSAVLVAPLNAVPLLPSGKVDYRTLQLRAETLQPPQAANPGTEALLRQALRLQVLDLDRSFLELGGDSLAYLEVQMHLLARLGEVPANWEHMPLRTLLSLEKPPAPAGAGTTDTTGPIARAWQAVPADLLARVVAILAVIALHSTSWPVGGGAYLLLILVGYSLARFQSGVLFEGNILRTWRSMLIPILTCYYLLIGLIALFRAPVPVEWFLLLGNFQDDIPIKGLVPYWFVSAYAQIIVIVTLPFLVPAFRRQVARQPLAAGLIALAGLVLVMQLSGVADISPASRHRHPVAALELLVIGWCAFFARQTGEKLLTSLAVATVLWIGWRDVTLSTKLLMLIGTGAVIWNAQLRLPVLAARALMQVGALTLFLYLAHAPIISVVSHAGHLPNILRFILVTGASLVVAFCLKTAYDRLVGRLSGRSGGDQAPSPELSPQALRDR